jgi:hypothetical protein
VASKQAAEAVGGDWLEPEWEFADVGQHVRGAVIAPTNPSYDDAAGGGRDQLGRAVHGGLLGGGTGRAERLARRYRAGHRSGIARYRWLKPRLWLG